MSPSVTVVFTFLPLTSLSTYVEEPLVCRASAGTVSTLLTCLVMIATVAEVPTYSPLCLPVMVTVTGNCAAPVVLVSATRLIAVTVP